MISETWKHVHAASAVFLGVIEMFRRKLNFCWEYSAQLRALWTRYNFARVCPLRNFVCFLVFFRSDRKMRVRTVLYMPRVTSQIAKRSISNMYLTPVGNVVFIETCFTEECLIYRSRENEVQEKGRTFVFN